MGLDLKSRVQNSVLSLFDRSNKEDEDDDEDDDNENEGNDEKNDKTPKHKTIE